MKNTTGILPGLLWAVLLCLHVAHGLPVSGLRGENGFQETVLEAYSLAWENGLPVREWTAFGDSYAAGIGAGKGIDARCSLYDQSYPSQMQRDDRLISRDGSIFNNLPCAASLTKDVIKDQLPRIGNPDLATISTGGNDAHFFRVINACIYRFNGLYSGDCEIETLKSIALLNTYLFYYLENTYNAILDAAASKDFRLYVTGYAQFFNENTTQCDQVSFNYWSWPAKQYYLTQEARGSINYLVRKLNMVIIEAIDRVNSDRGAPMVVYVDYDLAFKGHRFCEEGVNEPDWNNPNTWFINTYTDITLEHSMTPKQSNSSLFQPLSRANTHKSDDASVPKASGSISTEGIWPPDSWQRVFHPRPAGHKAIKEAAITAILRTHGRLLDNVEIEHQEVR